MVDLSDVDLVRCTIIGDEQSGIELMMRKYASLTGVPYNPDRKEIVTAFNGRKCTFVGSPLIVDTINEESHVFLLCVSIASRTTLEETAKMILDTIVERIHGVPFVLVGTQIDKRLAMIIENNGCGEMKHLPVPLNQAESYAKRIGANKYLECSEVTGEGLDEVFEGAFEIGHNYALEQMRDLRRKNSQIQEMESRKSSCITQ